MRFFLIVLLLYNCSTIPVQNANLYEIIIRKAGTDQVIFRMIKYTYNNSFECSDIEFQGQNKYTAYVIECNKK